MSLSIDTPLAFGFDDVPEAQNVRLQTTPVRHTCICGRLLGIQIVRRLFIKHRKAKEIAGGGARVACDGCKRATTFTSFEITRP